MTYGYEITQTRFFEGKTTWGYSGCETKEEAIKKCQAYALRCGWEPPKWWQWWRWSDNRMIDV